MRTIQAEKMLTTAEEEAIKGLLLDPAIAARMTIIDDDCDVLKPDGSALLRFRKRCLPAGPLTMAFPVLRDPKLIGRSCTRMTATGRGSGQRKLLADGTLSATKMIPMGGTKSGIIGYFDRVTRIPFCRQTAFVANHPREWADVQPLIREVDGVFREVEPERYAIQRAEVDRVNPAFRISGTAFTTVTVNHNWQSAVHKDSGDLPAGYGVMTAMEAGGYDGAQLAFPAWGIAVDMRTADLLLADVHEYHGNLPITGLRRGWQRVSCVFYMRRNMVDCGSPTQERARAASRRRGDRLYGPISSEQEAACAE